MRIHALVLACAGLLASRAYALGDCETDADCDDGFVCEEVGATGCAVACPVGETCADPAPCETETYYGCVAAPCEVDSDCGADMKCVTVSYEICSGGAAPDCAPGTECADAGAVGGGCTTQEESYCAPPYVGPCERDADCGEGFTCAVVEACACFGGGSVDGGAGTPASPPSGGAGDVADECTCEPTGEKYCEVQPIDCTVDADCPDGWTCEADVATVPCAYDLSTGAETCAEPTAEAKLCFPPYWEQGWGYARGGGSYEALAGATGSEDARAVQDNTPRSPGGGSGGDSGTCSVSRTNSSAPMWLGVSLLLAALTLRHRR